jgi:hypothetical protein
MVNLSDGSMNTDNPDSPRWRSSIWSLPLPILHYNIVIKDINIQETL